jgi:hypothetical protein
MMMDNCMDSRENRIEYVDRKVRAGLYAIDLCKTARNVAEEKPHVRKSFEPTRKYVSK